MSKKWNESNKKKKGYKKCKYMFIKVGVYTLGIIFDGNIMHRVHTIVSHTGNSAYKLKLSLASTLPLLILYTLILVCLFAL